MNPTMQRRWLVSTALLCLLLVVTTLFASNRPGKVDAVAPPSFGKGGTIHEWGGHRSSEYRPWGIPYSKTASVPGLKIMPDLVAALQKAGFQNLPEVAEVPEGENASRRTWKGTVCYYVVFPMKGTPKSTVDFYAKQLKTIRVRHDTPTDQWVEGTAPDGRTWISLTVNPGSTSAFLQFTPDRP